MKLYHFTSRYHVDGCLYEGIKHGKVLHGDFDKRVYLIPGYQWLTRNPDFNQSWHDEELTSLPYDRTEYRIEVNIPRLREKNLIKWTKYCKDNPQPVHETLNAFGDLENWYLYHGTILPVWLGNVDRKIKERGSIMIDYKKGYRTDIRRTLYPERIPITLTPKPRPKPYFIDERMYFWPRYELNKRVRGING